jgi:hypothetical protein
VNDHDTAPAGDAQQTLLAALAQRYADAAFSARDAAAAIPSALWLAAGVDRPDANSCGRWLRARRGPGLTGRSDRTGVVRWRVRGPTAPVAALQAPAAAASAPAPPLAQQALQPAPPATTSTAPPPATTVPLAQQPWWHPPAPPADIGLPGPRWSCTAWWSPDAGSAP